MDTIEVKLLKYNFTFKRLKWREEFAIKFQPKKDPIRVVLAYALIEVAGIKPKDLIEAQRVIDAIPTAIATRVWKIYKGGFPASRKFITGSLYKAPDVNTFIARVEEEQEGSEAQAVHDRAMQEMESKFSPEDLKTTRENDRKIFEAAQKRGGLTKASE